jgi:hypothetical protein
MNTLDTIIITSELVRLNLDVPSDVPTGWIRICGEFVTGVTVPGADVPGADVPGADVPGAEVPGADVPGALFEGVPDDGLAVEGVGGVGVAAFGGFPVPSGRNLRISFGSLMLTTSISPSESSPKVEMDQLLGSWPSSKVKPSLQTNLTLNGLALSYPRV